MKEAITLIIFTVPGLLTYFWINLFGISPASKKNKNEVTAISILLWIPIICVVLLIYNLLALVTHIKYFHPKTDIPILKKEWAYIDNLTKLTELSSNIWFLLFYILLTIIVSYYLAKFISNYAYKKILDQVNRVRKNRNLAPLEEFSSVWESLFLKNEGQIIEYKREGEEKSLIGFLKKVPRANEDEKSIVLEATDHWTKIMEYYDVQIDYTYVDIELGVLINIYNLEKALEAEREFNKRFPDGITS